MSWNSAFRRQAHCDNETFKLLRKANAPYHQQLHYLQMILEKLSKSVWADALYRTGAPWKHWAIDKALKHITKDLAYQRLLKMKNLNTRISSLAAFARKIEILAPALAGGGCNVEYPWLAGNAVTAPVDHENEFYQSFFDPRSTDMMALAKLLDRLLRIVK